MASLKALHDDMSDFFNCASLRLQTSNYELSNARRFDKSPIAYIESPLDKPLPPVPSPIQTSAPATRAPTSNSHRTIERRPTTSVADHAVWHKQYTKAVDTNTFIDSQFAENDIFFGQSSDGYGWKLGERMFEKIERNSNNLLYATALYECTQIKGRVRGPKAYMKIYMQVPRSCQTCQQTSACARDLPQWISSEVTALKRLSQTRGEVSAPRLLAMKTKIQSKHQWVPGGFLAFIVMQCLPGKMIEPHTFWNRPLHERDEIKKSFKVALQKVWQAGVLPRVCNINKLAWDESTKKCYIIDLQAAETIKHPLRWWDYEYYRWGLANASLAVRHYPRTGTNLIPTNTGHIDQKIQILLHRAVTKKSHDTEKSRPVRYELAANG